MVASLAFEVHEDDLVTVLKRNERRLLVSTTRTLQDIAEEAFADLDHHRVVHAALRGGDTINDQIEAAYADIEQQLVEIEVLGTHALE